MRINYTIIFTSSKNFLTFKKLKKKFNFCFSNRKYAEEPKARRRRRRRRHAGGGNDTITSEFMNDAMMQSARNNEINSKFRTIQNFTFYEVVDASTTSFLLRNLQHFSMYTISVKACREDGPPDAQKNPAIKNEISNCSNAAFINQRTLPIPNANDIKGLDITLENTNQTVEARLSWKTPEKPNSLIVSYTIKYYRVDVNHQPSFLCVSQREYQNLTGGFYILNSLPSGNYSIQIQATSLSGNGKYTAAEYVFIVSGIFFLFNLIFFFVPKSKS